MAPPIPTHIGRYEILSLLGRGGMGVLYKAKDPTLDREVALKMMLVDFSFDGTARERFEREAKAVARLQHANVVTIHELGQHEGAPYIVMELLSGEDLEAVLRRPEPPPLSTKLEIVAQLCEGLSYAHEQGIVHRDIKPANVRVLEDGTVKILDFGIAKFAQSSMTQSGAIMGTAHYMAPEQIMGNPLDGRADLFSVGVLLHELLSGKKPFAGDSPTAVVYQIVHGEAPSVGDVVSGLPEGLNEVVTRALKKDPNERYNSASDMASDLRLVKMMLDLPLSQTQGSGGFDATISPGRLHATGVVSKPPALRMPGPVTTAAASVVGAAKLPGGADTDIAPAPARGMSMGVIGAIAAGVVVVAAAAYFGLAGGGTGTDTSSGTATPAATTPPAATAAPAGATGALMVSSVPAGARITLNGTDTGKTTPSEVSLGGTLPATIELSLKGYQAFSGRVTEADAKRGSREFRLARDPAAVTLTISGPFPFELTRAGAVLSAAATQHQISIPPGGAPVTARNSEFLLNETIPIDFQRPQAEATIKASGILAVFASNETCSIIVDGQDLGFPPLARKPIAAGPHTVTLKCPDGKEDSKRIVVVPGERSQVTFARLGSDR